MEESRRDKDSGKRRTRGCSGIITVPLTGAIEVARQGRSRERMIQIVIVYTNGSSRSATLAGLRPAEDLRRTNRKRSEQTQ